MSFFNSLVTGPKFHAEQAGATYTQNPEQAMLGINTPAEAYAWNKATGKNYQPTVNMYGGPTQQQYYEAQQQGIDMQANRTADAIAPYAGAAVASYFGGPMAGAAALQADKAMKGYGRKLKRERLEDEYEAVRLAQEAEQGYYGGGTVNYVKGGITTLAKKHLASKGRYGDSTLMHVNPRELAGLQAIMKRSGGTLTTNPDTGLPEAFNFMRFMPMIAGAALAPYTGGASAALIVGAAEGVRTRSITGGLRGALAAYGGASAVEGLSSFGAEGLGASAPGAGVEAGTNVLNAPGAIIPPAPTAEISASMAAPEAGLSGTTPALPGGAPVTAPTPAAAPLANVGPDQAGEMLRAGQISPETYAKYGQEYARGVSQYNPTSFSNAGSGISRAFTDPSAAGKAMVDNPMGVLKTAGSIAIGTQPTPEPYKPPSQETYGSSTKAEPYKRTYRENPNPYDSREFEYFRPNSLYVKEGGYIGMQTGGTPPTVGIPAGIPDDYKMYMQQLQQMINKKTPALTLSQFSMPISQPQFATQATPGSKPNTYAPGGITRIQKEGQVRGDGDGMDDKVYGHIEGTQKVALSRDEFIVPADVVSGLGNGSSNAGAEKLYRMMDRVRKARTGMKKQGKQIKGDRFLPA